MTAYELADAIEDWDSDGQWDAPAANMLRQQADRIKMLEANYKIQVDINEKALQYIDHLEQGLRASIDLNNAQAGRHRIEPTDRIG